MTLGERPAPGERPCHACGAPLAADQRYCVMCGERRAGVGADPATVLFGPAAHDHAAPPLAPPPPAAPAPVNLRRRRRAALPVALATLVGMVVVTGTNVPASLAGFSPPPFTVVLPPQVAQLVAQAPPAASPPPASDDAAPVDDAPVDDAPPDSAPSDTPVGDSGGTGGDGSDANDQSTDDSGKQAPSDDGSDESPIRHVFLIVLGSTDVTALADDPAAAPYLAQTLKPSGTLLSDFTTVARGSLANRIAMVSGQGPTQQTLDDCTTYGDVTPANALPDGQTGGDGCVYGYESGTVGDQLRGLERSWKAYIEPASPTDSTTGCRADASTTRRNPFLWFRGELEAPDCDKQNVGLDQLGRDLKDEETTPALAYIASDAQLGSADADAFLRRVVPDVLNSLAFANGGLVVITSDQPTASAQGTAPPADGTGTTPGATTTAPDGTTTTLAPDNTATTPGATSTVAGLLAPLATAPDASTDPGQTWTAGDGTSGDGTSPGDTATTPTDTTTTPAPPADTTTDTAPPSDTTTTTAPPSDTTQAPPADTTPTPPATTPTAPTDAPPSGARRAPKPKLAPGPTSYANVGDALAAGGGQRVGALLISPSTPSGSVDRTPANAFTLLATLEHVFGTDPLGYAGARGVEPLPARLFSQTP
jgi:hypothetical protein